MKNLPKQIIAWGICLGYRLIPGRPANAEPLLGTLMPFATRFSMVANLVWLMSGMVVYDYFTAGIGAWTWETCLVYALISVAASVYFKKVTASRVNYVGFALVATLFYDALTGPVLIPLTSHVPFMPVLLGQIPFTLAHLASNFLIAAFLSPIIQKWLVENPALELSFAEKQERLSI